MHVTHEKHIFLPFQNPWWETIKWPLQEHLASKKTLSVLINTGDAENNQHDKQRYESAMLQIKKELILHVFWLIKQGCLFISDVLSRVRNSRTIALWGLTFTAKYHQKSALWIHVCHIQAPFYSELLNAVTETAVSVQSKLSVSDHALRTKQKSIFDLILSLQGSMVCLFKLLLPFLPTIG